MDVIDKEIRLLVIECIYKIGHEGWIEEDKWNIHINECFIELAMRDLLRQEGVIIKGDSQEEVRYDY